MGWFDQITDPIKHGVGQVTGGMKDSGIPGLQAYGSYWDMLSGNTGGGGGGAGGGNAAGRNAALEAGYARGQKEFYDDPDMQRLRATREDLAKGYSGEELGALRTTARNEIAGSRDAGSRNLASRLARGGAGGARGAAVMGTADQKAMATTADAERKMALDSAQMKRTGSSDLQDFLFRQKYGKMGTGVSEAQLQSADYQAEQSAKANTGGGGGGCCFIFLESRYGNGTMDAVVRRFRDEHMTAQNKRGYYKLSEVLVPLMRSSKLVKVLVRIFMTDPLVCYGKAHYGGSKLGLIFAPVKNFWLKTFNYLGQDHEFVRENGEVV